MIISPFLQKTLYRALLLLVLPAVYCQGWMAPPLCSLRSHLDLIHLQYCPETSLKFPSRRGALHQSDPGAAAFLQERQGAGSSHLGEKATPSWWPGGGGVVRRRTGHPPPASPPGSASKQSLRWQAVQGTAHPGELLALDQGKATNETKWKI